MKQYGTTSRNMALGAFALDMVDETGKNIETLIGKTNHMSRIYRGIGAHEWAKLQEEEYRMCYRFHCS